MWKRAGGDSSSVARHGKRAAIRKEEHKANNLRGQRGHDQYRPGRACNIGETGRHISRTQRVDLAWLYDSIQNGEHNDIKCVKTKQEGVGTTGVSHVLGGHDSEDCCPCCQDGRGHHAIDM